MMIDCLAELVAELRVIRETIPDPATVNRWWRCSSVPFHRGAISLAGQLRAPGHHRGGPVAGVRSVHCDRALGWLHRCTGTELAPELAARIRVALTKKVA